MSQRIYESDIRMGTGRGQVRITDTAPGPQTPALSMRPAHAPIELKMGDGGRKGDGFPTTLGSSFELQIPDPQRAFQELFLSVFDDRRFTVELDIPGVGRWHGYVKSTLQTRPAARRPHAGTTSIRCFDGLALLGEEDTAVNARAMTVREFLADAFAEANPDLPVLSYVDVEAKTVEGNTVGLDKLRPIAGNPRSYEPPQPNGPSGDQLEEGLEGESLREQLNDLCTRFVAVAYQDIRQQAWAFVDVPSVGAPVTGARYDGSSWSSHVFTDQTISGADGGVSVEDDGRGAYKTQKSVRAVCTEVSNWITDPGFEATPNGTDLYFWTLNGAERTSAGKLTDVSSPGTASQTVDFSELLVYDEIDAIRIVADKVASLLEFTITFGNGDTVTESTPAADDVWYLEKDPNGGHDSIESVQVVVSPDADDLAFVRFNLLEKLTDNPVSGAGTNNKYRVVGTVCYTAGESGRTTVESDAGGFLTVLSGGEEVPATEWQSKRYSSSPYGRLFRWRAVNLLALRPPPYERLQTDLIGAYAPLGTRLKVEKPGESTETVFVPLKSRTLTLGEGEARTSLKDVEIPKAVSNLLP